MLAKRTHPQVKFQSLGFLTMCWDTECTADHKKFLWEGEVRGPVCDSKMNSPPRGVGEGAELRVVTGGPFRLGSGGSNGSGARMGSQ